MTLYCTLAGPTPTNISRNSEPETLRNGTPASPAVARARRVFPVPGGPERMAPYSIYIVRARPRIFSVWEGGSGSEATRKDFLGAWLPI